MNLTPHFTLQELTASDTALRLGIHNLPVDPSVTGNLYILAQGLERARHVLGKPMLITSGYRSPKLNEYIGGSKTSAHMWGLAADFRVPGMSPLQVCRQLESARAHVKFQQLIQEGGWTHIAFPEYGEPRGEVLTAHFSQGKVHYTKGLA